LVANIFQKQTRFLKAKENSLLTGNYLKSQILF
jgi:hypothetical protein